MNNYTSFSAQSSRSPQTGFSNTPSDSQKKSPDSCPVGGFAVRLDWLAGTGKISKIQPLLDFILPSGDAWAISSEYPYKMGSLKFTHSAKSASGIIVRWFQLTDDKIFYHLSLPGSFFKPLDLIAQFRYLRGLKHAYKLKCTRADIALDDYRRQITYAMLDKAIQRGDYAGFQVADPMPGRYRRVGDEVIQEPPTLYLGSKNSDKRICFYDAYWVHGISANRWELRYRNDFAEAFLNYVCSDSHDFSDPNNSNRSFSFGRFLSGFLAGAVSFVRRTDKNLSRCPLIQWWSRFLTQLDSLQVLSAPVRVCTIEKKLRWLNRQVSKSLCILKQAWGDRDFEKYINHLIESASWRFNDDDFALLQHLLQTS